MIADTVLRRVQSAASLYHRLVLVVGGNGSGKTLTLQELSEHLSAPVLNLNLKVSERLLDLTEAERQHELPDVLEELLRDAGRVVLLDNTEVLFDTSLQHDPLRLLQKVSRNRTVVASWNGELDGGHLTYAAPEHPEYRRYEIGDLLLIHPEEVLR